jgi:nicotinate-nucleotide adenylyltransferase
VLGGSFNPAHAGHLHIARQLMRRLQLRQIWLMVSPGNPLKASNGMAPLEERLASARAIADGRHIVATAIEARLGTRYTVDTLHRLRQLFPRVEFIWLMGADNLEGFPRWRGWLDIARTMPFAVHPRPTYNMRALAGQAAHRLRAARRAAHGAPSLGRPVLAPLGRQPMPAWVFLPAAQHAASATALRAAAKGV